ncbi:MAG: NUDIX hydrolase [Paracoccaceae bacterium]
MNMVFHKIWGDFIALMLQRPKRLQVAALCHRGDGEDRQYLLVTSRETKRWILPKGWPIRGLEMNEAALQEAWEEAGVKGGDVSDAPVGLYTYHKRKSSGWAIPVETLVYSVCVNDLVDRYPEVNQRIRKWVSADAAATMVDEGELQSLFQDLAV